MADEVENEIVEDLMDKLAETIPLTPEAAIHAEHTFRILVRTSRERARNHIRGRNRPRIPEE